MISYQDRRARGFGRRDRIGGAKEEALCRLDLLSKEQAQTFVVRAGADTRVGITGIMLSASKIDLSLEIIVFKLKCDELSVGGGNRTVNRITGSNLEIIVFKLYSQIDIVENSVFSHAIKTFDTLKMNEPEVYPLFAAQAWTKQLLDQSDRPIQNFPK